MKAYSAIHGYHSVRTDEEWDHLFTAATLPEVRAVEAEIIAAAREDQGGGDAARVADGSLRRDLQRITKCKVNAAMRRAGR